MSFPLNKRCMANIGILTGMRKRLAAFGPRAALFSVGWAGRGKRNGEILYHSYPTLPNISPFLLSSPLIILVTKILIVKKELDPLRRQAIGELGRQFSDATIRMHETIAQKAGLTGTDHKYLGILLQHGEMTAGELSKQTGLTSGAVTGLMDRLEDRDLARRRPDRDDRRKIFIEANRENAAKLFEPSSALLRERMAQLIATFSESEAQVIEKYLRSTIEAMNELSESL